MVWFTAACLRIELSQVNVTQFAEHEVQIDTSLPENMFGSKLKTRGIHIQVEVFQNYLVNISVFELWLLN